MIDRTLLALERWARSKPFLYRLTLGTRVLLAVGFIPTGMVKLLGRRFTLMDPATPIGGFFETLYQSGPYWRFLGLAQVVAGVLVVVPRLATLGAMMFLGIMLNVFVVTISYEFRGTPVVTGLMVLATLYLLVWDYHRWRGIVGFDAPLAAPMPEHRLRRAEGGVYATGSAAALAVLAATRSLGPVTGPWVPLGIVVGLACLLVALWFAVFRSRSGEKT